MMTMSFGAHCCCCLGLFVVKGGGPVLGQCGNGVHGMITDVCHSEHIGQPNTLCNQENEAIQGHGKWISPKLHPDTCQRRACPTFGPHIPCYKYAKLLSTGMGNHRDTSLEKTREARLHLTKCLETHSTIRWTSTAPQQLPSRRHHQHV